MKTPNNKSPRKPQEMDRSIGRFIHMLRKEQGLSQQELADRLGVTCQQVQKYETGRNRIAAGRLHDISRVLRVAITRFFPPFNETAGAALALQEKDSPFTDENDDAMMKRPDVVELVYAYCSISDTTKRQAIRSLLNALSEGRAVAAERTTPGGKKHPGGG